MIWRTYPGFDRSFDPFREVDQLQREMNRLFNGYRGRSYEFPEVNLWANEENTVVQAELPGVDPKDIQLTVANNTLSLEGERLPSQPQEEETFQRQERGSGRFSRRR